MRSYKKGKVDLWKIIVDLIIVLIMILIVKARIVDVMREDIAKVMTAQV